MWKQDHKRLSYHVAILGSEEACEGDLVNSRLDDGEDSGGGVHATGHHTGNTSVAAEMGGGALWTKLRVHIMAYFCYATRKGRGSQQ